MKLGINVDPIRAAAAMNARMSKKYEETEDIEKAFGETNGGWEDMEKALTHKYIRRIPKKSGKGFWYIYEETFKKPIRALLDIFAVKKERIDQDYTKHNVEKEYGADKKTFAAHILEYLSNKLKWDNIFSTKENREKYKKPVKQENVTAAASDIQIATPKLLK